MPQYLISLGGGKAILRNFEGVITTYTEPTDYDNSASLAIDRKNLKTEGVSQLLSLPHQAISLEPMGLERYKKAEKWHKEQAAPAPKKGRGRKKSAEEAGVEEAAAIAAVATEPKRRGRKPKATAAKTIVVGESKRQGRKSKAAAAETSAEPKRRGRKPKAEKISDMTMENATPKRRGRPAKAKKVEVKEPKRRGRKKKIIPPGVLAALPHRKKKSAVPESVPVALPEANESKPVNVNPED